MIFYLNSIINKVISSINYRLHEIWFFIISIIEFIYLRAIGIEVGNGIEFRGFCSIHFKLNSKIIIGNNCRFNSSKYTNHIGINHRCILSTEKNNAFLSIGNNCGFSGVSIACFNQIKIGNNVRVGANCIITDSDFHLDDPRVGKEKPVEINDNVWVGYGVIVMKGVTIGKNSIIGMNSVVTRNIPANVVAAGNPCRVIKELPPEVIIELEKQFEKS